MGSSTFWFDFFRLRSFIAESIRRRARAFGTDPQSPLSQSHVVTAKPGRLLSPVRSETDFLWEPPGSCSKGAAFARQVKSSTNHAAHAVSPDAPGLFLVWSVLSRIRTYGTRNSMLHAVLRAF